MGQGTAVSCCKPCHSVQLCLGAMGSSISAAHRSLGAPSPPRCQRTLFGRTGSSNGFLTKDLGVAATPHCHHSPRAVDSQCLLELCGPWWGTGLGSLVMSVFTNQHHLCGMTGKLKHWGHSSWPLPLSLFLSLSSFLPFLPPFFPSPSFPSFLRLD